MINFILVVVLEFVVLVLVFKLIKIELKPSWMLALGFAITTVLTAIHVFLHPEIFVNAQAVSLSYFLAMTYWIVLVWTANKVKDLI